MELSQVLGIINITSPEHARSLSALIPAELIQRRKTPGEDAVRELFDITPQHWNP